MFKSDTKFDIVIADDGSTHETRELIDSLKPTFPVPITHLWHEDNGFRKSKILNLAIEKDKEWNWTGAEQMSKEDWELIQNCLRHGDIEEACAIFDILNSGETK